MPIFDQGWDVLRSAPLYSQLAGVLSGFSFTSLMFLLASPRNDHESLGLLLKAAHRNAISMLISAFLTLAVASYLWGALAGDKEALLRTSFSAVPATMVLSLGALQMAAAIAWTVRYYEPGADRTATIGIVWLTILISVSWGWVATDALGRANYAGFAVQHAGFVLGFAGTAGVLLAAWGRLIRARHRSNEDERRVRQITTGVAVTLSAFVFFTFPASSADWTTPESVPRGWRGYVLAFTIVLLGVSFAAAMLLVWSTPLPVDSGISGINPPESNGVGDEEKPRDGSDSPQPSGE